MKSISCDKCGSKGHKLLFKTMDYDSGGDVLFNVVKCKGCGLIYLNPQPGNELLSKYYVFNYYGNQSFFYRIFLLINNFIIGHKANLILNKHKGRILDIGCGDGDFLKYMKNNGWDVYGIETSISGAEISRKKLKKHVYNAKLEKVKFQKEFFDVVTLWHVLEHVSSPNSLLKETKRIIKKNGALLIAVPNIDSWQAKIGSKKWFHLDVPRHLYHFSPEDLDEMLKKNGFKVEKINHFSFVYNLIGIIQTWLNMIGIKFNFLHHLIKRVDRQESYINISFIVNFLFTFIFGAIFFVPGIIFSLLESFFKHGATITVYAKKA